MKARWTPKYWLAPETHARSYGAEKQGPKVDLWRCGVLANILLSGSAPFEGVSEEEILEKARRGKFSFQADVWKSVSYDAKDFISQLLVADPSKRFNATQALKHAWIRKAFDFPIARKQPSLDPRVAFSFKKLSGEQIMREALVSMILNVMRAQKEINDLNTLFKLVDEQ